MNPREAFDRFWDAWWPLPAGEECVGAGCFGRWCSDADGLPAYRYEIDHAKDPRAAYNVSRGESRDHWHLVGNDRIIATAHNGGYVQVYDWTRGGKLLNRCDHPSGGGGFKIVSLKNDTLCTLWDMLPDDATQERVFGIGYFEKRTAWNGLVVTERIEAPVGDAPVLVSSCRIENTSPDRRDVTVGECWGHSIDQLLPVPLAMPPWGRLFRFRRRVWNRRFAYETRWDPEHAVMTVEPVLRRRPFAPAPSARSMRDHFPRVVFLAALDVDGSPSPTAVDTAQLSVRRRISLAPGDAQTTRYVFGYAEKEDISRFVEAPVKPAPRPALEFIAPDSPALQRELIWHSYYLQAGSIYSDYFQSHIVDQGSAYSYLHGLSGATRDFALFTLPMVYIRPDLAKDMLRFCSRLQRHGTGTLPYGLVGHGCVRGYGVHSFSSDLDLFYLWAASEYLAATQDRDFLDEPIPFYPLSSRKSGTFLDHCRAAFSHLTRRVGLGPHGLLRCGTGDWNDVLFAYSRFSPLTLWRGESAFNAGMAAMVLPRIADALECAAPDLAEDMRRLGVEQAAALEPLWAGDWLARGYLGYGHKTLGRDRLFLDAQSLPVVAGLWDSDRRARLFNAIRRLCVEPQGTGALCLWPPMKGPLLDPGSDTNGGTWAAIDGWLAWAWSLHDPAVAWDFFRSTTLAARAEAWPEVWYGVWSGPDSYNAHYHKRPGETFQLNATPMTDFPVMNMNRHASPLFAALKLAGIDPRGDTIVVDPHVPLDTFAVRTTLLGCAYHPHAMKGYYRPVAAGTFKFSVRPPASGGSPTTNTALRINDEPAPFTTDASGHLCFTATATPAQEIRWHITC